jgi:DNA-binding HxlR family transcriptional regulator
MKDKKNSYCPVTATLNVIGGRWKPLILYSLKDRTIRFGELKRMMPGITQKMLTQQLRELERDGIVSRRVYPQVPPKVEYALTEFGETLGPIMKSMSQWGLNHRKHIEMRMKAKLKKEMVVA